MSDNTLKPCPFCGGEAQIKSVGDETHKLFWGNCKQCDVLMPSVTTEYLAIAAWNTRSYQTD